VLQLRTATPPTGRAPHHADSGCDSRRRRAVCAMRKKRRSRRLAKREGTRDEVRHGMKHRQSFDAICKSNLRSSAATADASDSPLVVPPSPRVAPPRPPPQAPRTLLVSADGMKGRVPKRKGSEAPAAAEAEQF